MRKRILASILTLVMILSLMPVTALAVEDDGDGEAPVVCTLDENCEAETHVEGCPRYVAPEEPADGAEVPPAEEQEDDIMPLDVTPEETDPEEEACPTTGCTLEKGHDGDCDVPAVPYDYDRDGDGEYDSWDISSEDNASGDVVYAYVTENSTGYTLHFGGKGAMKDFSTPQNTLTGDWDYATNPWSGYQNPYYKKITDLVFEEGNAITSIGNATIYVEKNLTVDVVLPETITSIGKLGFVATPIQSIQFPDGLTSIGHRAFERCNGLTEIDLSNTKITTALDGFNGCANLSSVQLPTGLTSMETTGAFQDCTSLTSIALPDSLTQIGQSAFQGSGLTSIDLNNVSKVVTNAFLNCENLAEIDFGDAEQLEIGWAAFKNTGVTELEIPQSVTVGSYAFAACPELTKVTVYGAFASGSYYHFQNCGKLETAVIDVSGEVLQGAFDGCANLKDVTIGDNVTRINAYTFRNCTSLNELTLPASTEILNTGGSSTIYKVTVKEPSDSGTNYKYINNSKWGTAYDDATLVNWYSEEGATASGSTTTTIGNHSSKAGTFYAVFSNTLSFNANGGTGTISDSTSYFAPGLADGATIAINGKTCSLPSGDGLSREGYTLSGWNTEADGSGTSFSAGVTVESISNQQLTTLYAQWVKEIGENSDYTVNAILDQTYTGAEIKPAVVVKDSSGNSTENYTVTYSDNTNVGPAKATVTVNGASVDLTFQIVQDGNPTIEMAGESVTYGEPYTMTATAKTSAGNQITGDGIISIEYYTDEACEEEWTGADGETQPTAAGTYYVKAVLRETDNYASKSIVATLTISKGEFSVTAEDYARAYDGKAHSITVNAGDAAVTYSTAETGPYDEKNPTFTDAGVYTVYYIARKENYEDRTGHATVNITKAPLTATYVSESIQYGQTPALTVNVTGFVNGETADTAQGYAAPTVSADYTNVGQYTLTPVGGSAANYTFNYVSGLLEITSADYPVSISADKPLLSGGGTVTFTVNADAAIQVSGLICDDAGITVTDNGDGTYSAVLPNAAKTYTFTVDVAGDMSNYEGGPAACTVAVTYKSTGSSSSSSSGTYAVSVDSGKNGTVAISPKNAAKGATVTITVKPNSGYELDDLTVTDKNGDTVKVKSQGDNKYTFTMPASKVTVEASFVKIAEQPKVSFADVSASAYYYDAVAWAVENGVTSGTTAATFSPNAACTRAQTVTFLWRAAGSPAPKSSVNPFTDVRPGDYYYDAVLWAVENGITSGTTVTTFSPNATVTRGQTVTFLHRAAGTAVTGSSPFADVSASAYYAGAVKWAVAEGITSGTTASTFSPDAPCTRAQIVTFLYRAEA